MLALLRCYRGPIGKDESKESPMYGLYRDWLYRKEICRFLGLVEVGGVCWVYRGPTGKDESDGEMVVWFE